METDEIHTILRPWADTKTLLGLLPVNASRNNLQFLTQQHTTSFSSIVKLC